MKKFRIWETSLLVALSISLCTALWAEDTGREISGNLLRLHVVAADNSSYEQALKLRVRDEVLRYISPKLEEAESLAEAEQCIMQELEGIARAASAAAEGRKVSVSFTEEPYPTKSYAAFSLPAGTYRSLRIVLDEGKGENWWCVVFPPVCLTAAQTDELRAVMGEQEFKIISEPENYVLRFKIIELWGAVSEKFAQ